MNPFFNPCSVFFQTVAFVLPSPRNPQQCTSNISRTFGTLRKWMMLKDFWYTAEVDDANKGISFSLSLFENQLSFTRFDFLTSIGLTDSKSVVPLPPKGTVRAGLATLGLADKDKPSLTSTELEPDESLILPSEKVNAEATADKSQSGTNVQPLYQPKAPTAKKSKKKKIISLTQQKVSNDSREMNPPSITTHIQGTEEFVVIAVPIQSLEASVTVEVQDNQLKAADTTEVLEKIVEKEEVAKEQTLEIPTLLDEVNKVAQETPQSPYDTES
ncbi:hypothetical protein Tco_1244892 [Tanacetum coccineum]